MTALFIQISLEYSENYIDMYQGQIDLYLEEYSKTKLK